MVYGGNGGASAGIRIGSGGLPHRRRQRKYWYGGCCMKKTIFVFVLMLFTTVVFGLDDVRTSTGVYWVGYNYKGKYQGEKRAAWWSDEYEFKESIPHKSHWECINYVLSMYTPTKGDTFEISITKSYTYIKEGFWFVCEYISATEYKYWFFEDDFFY
jgi:hypothetical protein